jgi:hypothetical protein
LSLTARLIAALINYADKHKNAEYSGIKIRVMKNGEKKKEKNGSIQLSISDG